jgi:outer membrane receptor protein involved in Fe transport
MTVNFFKLSALTLALASIGTTAIAADNSLNGSASTGEIGIADSSNTVTVTGQHYANGVGTSDAASQGTINGNLLKDIAILRPTQVLENVPGLVVTQHSGDGKASQYFLRGYNLDHGTDFATSIEGVPVNMPSHAHGQGYSDLNFLIPELVQRITYRKGPYFPETGDFSSAGSANIVYRDHLDQNFANITLGDEKYRRLVLGGSKTLGNDGPTLLGGLELLQNNGPWETAEKFHKLNGVVRLTDGDAQHGWSVSGFGYNAHWNSSNPIPLAWVNSGQIDRFGAIDPTDGGNSSRAILTAEWHDSDADGYRKASVYAERYQLQLISNFTFYELRPLTGDQFEQHEQRNIFGGQLAEGWNYNLLGLKNSTEIGAQLRHDRNNVGLQDTELRDPFEVKRHDFIRESLLGVYIDQNTTWTDWFKTKIGVRGDAIQMNVTSYTQPLNTGADHAHKLSPKLSLIFGPWQKTEVFYNYGRGFHSNDARGVIDKIDATTGSPSDPVPALVGSIGQEIGLRTEVIPGLQSSLALWSLNSESELTYTADSSIGSSEANGASRRYGVEWNNHWIAKPWLLFDADLAWTHARYAEKNANGDIGNLIPNAASKVALLRATLRNRGAWSASLETRYIGGYPLTQDGSQKAPSAIVTNLRVQYDVNPKATVTVDALNLLNRKYYDIAYAQDYRATPTGPDVPNGVTVHPGEPREIRLSLNYKF